MLSVDESGGLEGNLKLKNEVGQSLSQDNKQSHIVEYFVGEGAVTENYIVAVEFARLLSAC